MRPMRYVLLIILLTLAITPAHAHRVPRNGAGTAVQVIFGKNKILLTYDMGFGAVWGHAEMLSMDTDRDLYISEEEATVYRLNAWKNHIQPLLKVILNDIQMPVRLISNRSDTLVGVVASVLRV